MQPMHKKGAKFGGIALTIGIFAVVAILFYGFVIAPAQQRAIEPEKEEVEEITKKELQSCSGVQSVNALFNDKDFYKIGTDPGTNLTVYSKDGNGYSTSILDDATGTTVPVLSKFKALAANQNGAHDRDYFAEDIEFETVCSDEDIQTRLKLSGAPTLTHINDDGVTVNTVTAYETTSASTAYHVELTARAPAEKCSSRYGAVLACQYDASYVSKIESVTGLSDKQYAIYLPHSDSYNATTDQWHTMEMDGELCDGSKQDLTFKYTTTSSEGASFGEANINCTWLAINKDLDADEFTMITGIYDEDNTQISPLATSFQHYTT